MKELYIAPEVLIMCFAPVEELANSDWASYAIRSGSTPDTPDEEIASVETELPDDENDGEG